MTSVWQLGRGRTMLYGDNRGQSTATVSAMVYVKVFVTVF